MSPETLLEHLLAQGAHLEAREGRLLVDAPPGVLTRELKDELAARKAELLDLIAPRSRGATRLAEGPYAGFLIATDEPTPDPVRAQESQAEAERWRQKRAEWLRSVLGLNPREDQ